MPTPKGRNRKARRAAAAFVKSAADPPVEEEVGSSSKAAAVEGSKSAASHEKQRRQRQRQQQQLESSNKKTAVSVVAPGALPGVQGSTSKGKDSSGKKKDNVAGTGTARNGKKKDPATTGGEDGGNIADLDADDFLSGGFMSMAGIPNDEHKAGRELEGGGGGGGDDSSSGDNDGVDGSSSDDEDDEGGDGGVVGEDESDSDDEDANASAMDLKGLAETDPEFYSFLQKEEPTLLEFDPMDSDDSEDEDGDGGEGGGAAAEGADGEAGAETTTTKSAAALLREASKGGGVSLTMPLLRAMRQEAFDRKSIQGVRRMIKAFRCGCHLGDEAAEGKAGSGSSGVQQKFRIPSSEVYNELMVSSLEGLHPAFMHLLFPGRESKTVAEPPVTASGGGSKSEGAKNKRRRDEDKGEGEGAAVAAAGSSSSGPSKKKKKRGKGGTPTAAADDEKGGDSGEGVLQGENARKVVEGAGAERGGAPQEDGGEGALARGRSRVAAAVILTKEDFRAAALLPAWKPIQPALYSFFKSLLHVLDELHDRALLSFLLSRLEHYIPLLVPFPGLARGFLKALLGLWGGAGAEAKSSGGGTEQEGEEAERVRLLAYLRVRQMAAALPFPFVEGCMKRLYLAFAKRARAPPASQSGKVSLRVMEGCVVELYGMDVGSAYQNAFLYIRQLSLLLRRAMQHKTKDSVQAVRRWQVVTCLRVWTGVLAAAPGEDELRMLIFPLAQVIEGIVRLSATLRHSPLVFQLVRMRQRLAAAAELYVPCATPLLEVIRSPALFKKATASTGAPPNVPAILRLGKTQVEEGRAQGAVVEEALRLLGQEMDLYRYSAAFPELVLPVLGHLKKFAKLTKVSKWRMMTRGLVETLETRATWAAEKRLELAICPSDVEGLEVLRPKGAPSMRERLGASEAEVERVVDDDNTPPTSKAIAAGTAKGKSSETKKAKKQKGNAVQDHDDDTEDDDSDDDGSSTSKHKRSSGGGGGKAKSPSAAGAAGDISAPDLVEDLGAWSDTEWD